MQPNYEELSEAYSRIAADLDRTQAVCRNIEAIAEKQAAELAEVKAKSDIFAGMASTAAAELLNAEARVKALGAALTEIRNIDWSKKAAPTLVGIIAMNALGEDWYRDSESETDAQRMASALDIDLPQSQTTLAMGCHRSHPHEDMDAGCQRLTEMARAASKETPADPLADVRWVCGNCRTTNASAAEACSGCECAKPGDEHE